MGRSPGSGAFVLALGSCVPAGLVVATGFLCRYWSDSAYFSRLRYYLRRQSTGPMVGKLFVIFRRSWRIRSGAPAEMIVLVIFGTLAWGGGYMGAMGGSGL